VGNAQGWEDGEMMVTVVCLDRTSARLSTLQPKILLSLGNISVRSHGDLRETPRWNYNQSKAIFLLPSTCDTRRNGPADTVGLVVEVPRYPEALSMPSERFGPILPSLSYRAEVRLQSIVKDSCRFV